MNISGYSEEDLRKLIEAKTRLEIRERQLSDELAMASELQKSLLPRDYPSDLPLEIVHRYMPFQEVGGDFFDYIRLDNDRIGIIITDVSGHGIASSFLTAMFKGAFFHAAPQYNNAAETMDALNKEFCSFVHTEHYLTAFYIIIDTAQMVCQYCNAGHPRQLLIRRNRKTYELSTTGFFLGMFEGTDYGNRTFRLEPGDTICLFTDGIPEITGKNNEQYGRKRIGTLLKKSGQAALEDTANTLVTDIVNFAENPVFEDDITFLLIRLVETI